MKICERCLKAIESHEGSQISRKMNSIDDEVVCGDFDDEGNFVEDEYGLEEAVFCEWCGEMNLIDDMYEI